MTKALAINAPAFIVFALWDMHRNNP